MTTLQGTYIDSQPYVLVPLQTLIELLGRNAPVKLLTPATGGNIVIVPPMSEKQAMDADVDRWKAAGKLPEFVVPWRSEDEGAFD